MRRNGRFFKLTAVIVIATGMVFGAKPLGVKSTPTIATFTDSRDGKTYRTVTIGGKTWMAENLNYSINGSKCYDNNPSNCDKYGKLYNWEAAINVCPRGWDLPNEREWEMLASYIGGDVGKKLKSKSGWYKNGNGTDNYGFSALPSGTGRSDGSFILMGEFGYWWSIGDGTDAYYRYISFSDDILLGANSSTKKGWFPVRCVRGNAEANVGVTSNAGTIDERQDTSGWLVFTVIVALVIVIFIAVLGISHYLAKRKYYRIELEDEDKTVRMGEKDMDVKELAEKAFAHMIDRDWGEAASFLEKAAEHEHMGSQYLLGEFYEDGKGVSQSWEKAAYWYAKAAKQGHPGAQCNLGTLYYNGTGVHKNKGKAKKLHTKAAEQGHEVAQRNLSKLSYGWDGCYIATCVYGSYDCPEVLVLRRFRDDTLSQSWLGRRFIRFYYAVSPKLVESFGDKKWFTGLWKPIICKIVSTLQNSDVGGSANK